MYCVVAVMYSIVLHGTVLAKYDSVWWRIGMVMYSIVVYGNVQLWYSYVPSCNGKALYCDVSV